MTTSISSQFEHDSSDIDFNTIQMCYHEKSETKLLGKKTYRDNEQDEDIQMKDEFETNFGFYEKFNIVSEEEKSSEDENLYFINNIQKKKKIFEPIYPEIHLFKKSDKDLLNDYLQGVDFSIRRRSSKRLPNYKQNYYIRVNVNRNFLNRYLITALNKKLKKAGFITFFRKFPQEMVRKVTKDKNKILMNMRLNEIIKAEELYVGKDRTNFKYNLDIVNKIEKDRNPELNVFLNRKMFFLFEEYLNSEEFGILEINRLKKSKKIKDEYYIKKYIYLAIHFIDFCNQRVDMDTNN